MYANTGVDSDTSIVPMENGVETFTNIRGEDASEMYSMKVTLPGSEELVKLDEDTVAIVDPTPADKPADDTLPEPARPGTQAASRARDSSGISTPDADPRAASEVSQALEDAGTEKPDGVAEAEIKDAPEPTEDVTDEVRALVGSAPDGVGSGEPRREEVDRADPVAEKHETDEQASEVAEAALARTRANVEQTTDAMNAGNDRTAADQVVVVATVKAPESVDADGNSVETKLTVDGDVITMHVDHQDENVAYPIAADPIIVVMPTRWVLRWFPLLREETYVSHWAVGQRYIGNWHPVFCQWGWIQGCSGMGVPAWYSAYAGGTRHSAFWPAWNWGPVWQDYYYPVYATRWVVAMWLPYWAPDMSSLVQFSLFESGGSDHEEDGGLDDYGNFTRYHVQTPAIQVTGTNKRCKRLRLNYDFADASQGIPGTGTWQNWNPNTPADFRGHMHFTTKFCWNPWKKITKFIPGQTALEPDLGAGFELAGWSVNPGQNDIVDNYTWEQGQAAQLSRSFDVVLCAPARVACTTRSRGEIVRRARWNGSHYGTIRDR